MPRSTLRLALPVLLAACAEPVPEARESPGPCAVASGPTGHDLGDRARDFELVDQQGAPVRLYDFCDARQVLLVSSAMWCGACVQAAPALESWFQAWEPDGLTIITLLGEDVDGRPATEESAARWADVLGVTHPVLADPDWRVTRRFAGSGPIALPSFHQLGEGFEVLRTDARVSADDVREAL